MINYNRPSVHTTSNIDFFIDIFLPDINVEFIYLNA